MKGKIELTQNFKRNRIKLQVAVGEVRYRLFVSEKEGTEPHRDGVFLDFSPVIEKEQCFKYGFTAHLMEDAVGLYKMVRVNDSCADQEMKVSLDQLDQQPQWDTPVTWDELKNRHGKFHYAGYICRGNSSLAEHTSGWVTSGDINLSDDRRLMFNTEPGMVTFAYFRPGEPESFYSLALKGENIASSSVEIRADSGRVSLPLEALLSE